MYAKMAHTSESLKIDEALSEIPILAIDHGKSGLANICSRNRCYGFILHVAIYTHIWRISGAEIPFCPIKARPKSLAIYPAIWLSNTSIHR